MFDCKYTTRSKVKFCSPENACEFNYFNNTFSQSKHQCLKKTELLGNPNTYLSTVEFPCNNHAESQSSQKGNTSIICKEHGWTIDNEVDCHPTSLSLIERCKDEFLCDKEQENGYTKLTPNECQNSIKGYNETRIHTFGTSFALNYSCTNNAQRLYSEERVTATCKENGWNFEFPQDCFPTKDTVIPLCNSEKICEIHRRNSLYPVLFRPDDVDNPKFEVMAYPKKKECYDILSNNKSHTYLSAYNFSCNGRADDEEHDPTFFVIQCKEKGWEVLNQRECYVSQKTIVETCTAEKACNMTLIKGLHEVEHVNACYRMFQDYVENKSQPFLWGSRLEFPCPPWSFRSRSAWISCDDVGDLKSGHDSDDVRWVVDEGFCTRGCITTVFPNNNILSNSTCQNGTIDGLDRCELKCKPGYHPVNFTCRFEDMNSPSHTIYPTCVKNGNNDHLSVAVVSAITIGSVMLVLTLGGIYFFRKKIFGLYNLSQDVDNEQVDRPTISNTSITGDEKACLLSNSTASGGYDSTKQ
eukprot:Pgem_evm1s1221